MRSARTHEPPEQEFAFFGQIASRTSALVSAAAAACVLGLMAGCGSAPPPANRPAPSAAEPRPDVATRVVTADRFLGLPPLPGRGDRVRTDPAELSADSPGLYADPETALVELRRDGFVAGTTRIFKRDGRPSAASSTVVQMRDVQGAEAEFERQVDSALAPPCPGGLRCGQDVERFTIPGLEGAAGVRTTQRIEGQASDEHPDVVYAQTIVFRKGPFVHQVFLGTDRPGRRHAELIAAARALAERN